MINVPVVQISHREGIIDLGWGHPDPGLLPVGAMQRAAASAFARYGADALAYGFEPGPGPLLAFLRERLAQTDARAPAPGEIMITAGASHALDQVCTLLASPGDVALVESPTYHLAVRVLRDHPLDLVAVPVDAEGLQVDMLAETVAALRREGRRPRLLYSVPTHHNPTGVCLSDARRRALVELAAREGLLVVEDDVYRELNYDAPSPPSLWSLAEPGSVVRLGSFAKTLAPGLRLGWLTADAPTIARFTKGGLLDSGGGVNHFTAVVVGEACISGDYVAQIERLRDAYRERRDALLAGLREHLPPGCAVRAPGGGFFVWVRLPDGTNAATLLPQAEATGMSFLPGTTFHLDQSDKSALRLAFSLYPPETLGEAARRLGTALRAEVIRELR
jgi:DNA-binding transcriptional MocR family regulator